ncbi:hypothetical protein OE88DRAFT_1651289 [Heliocybe sulcata]|uniref:Uncharacterized protein n=1 Tax=Heliocybe sulcata TaxID=5364 RepID=A0A5C3NII9_9AGAM|nr:hypothetical protein OE88DRAFT_1651289 [Heliocybe sulcata]
MTVCNRIGLYLDKRKQYIARPILTGASVTSVSLDRVLYRALIASILASLRLVFVASTLPSIHLALTLQVLYNIILVTPDSRMHTARRVRVATRDMSTGPSSRFVHVNHQSLRVLEY